MTIQSRLSSVLSQLKHRRSKSGSKPPPQDSDPDPNPSKRNNNNNNDKNNMTDPGLNSLLQWSLENSEAARDPNKPVTEPRGLSADALRALMGGPSDADLMKQAMSIIVADDTTPEAKMTAFDNFEQLVENLDNANNMEPLGLWPPLLSQLDRADADLRRMAAWCIGTAVQNNAKSQEKCLAAGGVKKLCSMALDDPDRAARRKAVYALSSSIRNYQPAMDEAVKNLPKDIVGPDRVSAAGMDVIDAIMAKLRDIE